MAESALTICLTDSVTLVVVCYRRHDSMRSAETRDEDPRTQGSDALLGSGGVGIAPHLHQSTLLRASRRA